MGIARAIANHYLALYGAMGISMIVIFVALIIAAVINHFIFEYELKRVKWKNDDPL